MNRLRAYIRQQNIAQRIVESASLAVILACIAVSIRMTVVGRSLWLDEAMLAISFNTRSFFGLFVPPLEWNQSAPVVWLFLERIVSTIGGNTEASYRILSIVFYILLLLVFGILCRRTLLADYPMLCTAGMANIAFLLKYSNMFKPYISDGLCVLLVLLLWERYRNKKLDFGALCTLYSLLIWCSNPVAFFAGGVVVVEAVAALIGRNRRRFLHAVILGICIVASFLLMYLIWLAPTIAATNLKDFWEGYEFPLIHSAKTLKEAGRDIRYILKGIGPLWQAAGWVALAAVVVNLLIVHDAYLMAMSLGVAIALLASHLGFFPMSDRLWLFMVPVTVYADYFLLGFILCCLNGRRNQQTYIAAYNYAATEDSLSGKQDDICDDGNTFGSVQSSKQVDDAGYQATKEHRRKARNAVAQFIYVILIACLLISGGGIAKYHSGKAYIKGEEANPALAYISGNLTAEDQIYVYYPGIPVFMYKMGYNTDSVGGITHNVYYGNGYFHKGKNQEDVDWILSQKGCYVFFSHVVKYQPLDKCLDRLNSTGTLEKIKDKYLYYYSDDGSQAKGRFSYDLGNVQNNGDGTATADVTIHNDGDTYLNNGMETWVLAAANRTDPAQYDAASAVEIAQIKPGKSVSVAITFPVTGSGEMVLQLYNTGKYPMSERGVTPVAVMVGE